jgi:hypothetical protein
VVVYIGVMPYDANAGTGETKMDQIPHQKQPAMRMPILIPFNLWAMGRQ